MVLSMRLLIIKFCLYRKFICKLSPEIKVTVILNIAVGLGKSHSIKDGGINCYFLDGFFVKFGLFWGLI